MSVDVSPDVVWILAVGSDAFNQFAVPGFATVREMDSILPSAGKRV